jgi:NAD(P)-dependent dehydrogenase (short-subunit alcohol dehydrogenase family)
MHKKILITGATSGFGAGTAIGLAQAGHHVTAAGETWQQVRALRERAKAEGVKGLDVIKLDLLDQLDLAHAADRDIDILVLNAAIQESGSLVDIPLERVRRSFEINVFGHLDLVQRVAPAMLKRRSGKIVWVSSQAGLIPLPFLGTYSATKHAIEGIASTMRIEFALFNVGVATINPGFYHTGFNETGAESSQQWSHARDVHIPMPPAGLVLALQKDPQPMIDAMIEAIPDAKSAYRTMLPEEAIVETKLAQELGWKTKAS